MSERGEILERDMLRRAVFTYASAYKGSDERDPLERRMAAMRAALRTVRRVEREFVREEMEAFKALTVKQMDVIELLADGLTYKQIALKLHLAESTVRTHIHFAYEKLGVLDRASAVLLFERCRSLLHNPDAKLP